MPSRRSDDRTAQPSSGWPASAHRAAASGRLEPDSPGDAVGVDAQRFGADFTMGYAIGGDERPTVHAAVFAAGGLIAQSDHARVASAVVERILPAPLILDRFEDDLR